MNTENPWVAAAAVTRESAVPQDHGQNDTTDAVADDSLSRETHETPSGATPTRPMPEPELEPELHEAGAEGEEQSAFDEVLVAEPEPSLDNDEDETEATRRPPLLGFAPRKRGEVEVPDEVPVTGPVEPQTGVAPLPHTLATASLPEGIVAVVGAHGGAGASSIAALEEGWVDAGQTWPDRPGAACVLVARSHARGLLALRDALAQWASLAETPGVKLLGVIVVADAPGKLPPTLADLEKVVVGGAPRVWRVGFQDSWRQGDPPRERRDRAVKKMIKQVTNLASETTDATHKEDL